MTATYHFSTTDLKNPVKFPTHGHNKRTCQFCLNTVYWRKPKFNKEINFYSNLTYVSYFININKKFYVQMITRQSRKTDGSTAAGKLFLSSENSRRDPILHYSNVDPAVPSQVVTTRRSTRFSNSANSVKVRLSFSSNKKNDSEMISCNLF